MSETSDGLRAATVILQELLEFRRTYGANPPLTIGETDAIAFLIAYVAARDAEIKKLRGEQSEGWCQPMDNGEHTARRFIVRFDDADMADAVFENEQEAREYWTKANQNWNCYLFGALPQARAAIAHAVEEKANG